MVMLSEYLHTNLVPGLACFLAAASSGEHEVVSTPGKRKFCLTTVGNFRLPGVDILREHYQHTPSPEYMNKDDTKHAPNDETF